MFFLSSELYSSFSGGVQVRAQPQAGDGLGGEGHEPCARGASLAGLVVLPVGHGDHRLTSSAAIPRVLFCLECDFLFPLPVLSRIASYTDLAATL